MICWNISLLMNNASPSKMKQSYWELYTPTRSENTADRKEGLLQANWCRIEKICQFGSITPRECLMDVIIEDVSTCSKSKPKCYAMLIHFFNVLFNRIMKADPNHQACLPIYITCLVAMKNSQGTQWFMGSSVTFLMLLFFYSFVHTVASIGRFWTGQCHVLVCCRLLLLRHWSVWRISKISS